MNTHEQIKYYAKCIKTDFKAIGYSNRDILTKIIKRNGKSFIYISILDMNININLIRKISDRYNFKNDDCTYIFVDYIAYLKNDTMEFLQPLTNKLFHMYQLSDCNFYFHIQNNSIYLKDEKISIYDINNKILYDKDFNNSAELLNYFIFDLIYYFNYLSISDLENVFQKYDNIKLNI